MLSFIVRPAASEKTPFRINLTSASLLALKLRPGDLCNLCLVGDEVIRQAIAWENSGHGMKDNIVQMSKFLQMHHGFKLGDRISIQRSLEQLQDAKTVVLQPTLPIPADEQQKWSLFASASVPPKHDVLAVGQQVGIEVGDQKQEFKVVSVGPGSLGRVSKESTFTFEAESEPHQKKKPKLDLTRVCGLKPQVDEIQWLIDFSFGRDWSQEWDQYERVHGLIIHGGPGSGKSLIREQISVGSWANIIQWKRGLKITSDTTPQLITINLDLLSVNMDVTIELLELFSSIAHSDTLVLGTTRDLSRIPGQLRDSKTFAREIELPAPTASQRYDILLSMKGSAVVWDDKCVQELASRTHGFSAGDLKKIMCTLWEKACRRQFMTGLDDLALHEIESTVINEKMQLVKITQEDIEEALVTVRPSALNELSFEKPKVRWSDIGGLHTIKRQLQNAIDMPLKHSDRMKAFGLEPKKGILLYGPPGCSKTLIVRALSAETDLNFISIKAAELVSMYVGESEKATREIFRKARLASPCIIFFDEIDAIASRATSGSQLNILQTLLTEMDGFNAIKNVFVVAATNKPQSLDLALLRPGRFDNVVYMGPPDIQTRQEIFDKRFAPVEAEEGLRQQTLHFAKDTEGRSGAEIVAICQAAGENAFHSGRNCIQAQDVFDAIKSTPKGISAQMLEEYARWQHERET